MNIFKTFLKVMAFTLAAIFLLDVGMWAGFQSYQYYKTYPVRKLARGLEQMTKERELLYKNDLYGGKTPEETFVMYVEALKKGDLDLASRYFVLSGQAKELEALKKMSPEQMVAYVKKIDGSEKVWKFDDKGSWGNYRIYYVTEEHFSLDFTLNESSKVWKLESI